jgi:pimeloyl-ACP methyl ester carboxylesterase
MAIDEPLRPKEPLGLLHGITMSGRVWDRTIPFLKAHHQVLAPTLMGHHGGATPVERPVRLGHLVDDIERILDQSELGRPHFAGNSLGGWIALELAGRGRASSVCALSPAGFWNLGTRRQLEPPTRLKRVIREARHRVSPLRGRKDRILPLHVNGAIARRRMPSAQFIVLPGVGHVPMIDDPQLVARTILESTGATEVHAAAHSPTGEAISAGDLKTG